jgi:hypothetical protein
MQMELGSTIEHKNSKDYLMIKNVSSSNPLTNIILHINEWILLFLIFYWAAFYSVSDFLPNAIPVHHDDYDNYSLGAGQFHWSFVRPLSYGAIFVLSYLGPEWLIWSVRILTVTLAWLAWCLLVTLNRPRYYWITFLFFGFACFLTPIIVDYGRYTGMITHLLSGCLGLGAVVLLFHNVRNDNSLGLPLSALLIVLSSLAKEDFVLFYAVSLWYVSLTYPKDRKVLLWGLAGLCISIFIVVSSKFFGSSPFLSGGDPSHPYHVNISLWSIVSTVHSYLTGAGNPAVVPHGWIILTVYILSSFTTILIIIFRKKITQSAYLVIAVLCIILHYSVLPNHVYSSYEWLWVPLIIVLTYTIVAELVSTSKNTLRRFDNMLPLFTLALFVAALFFTVDPGRKSIAAWYDNITTTNKKTILLMKSQKDQINVADSVCIYGAGLFSPWHIHGGQYLQHVLGLNTTWYVVSSPSDQEYKGLLRGAENSGGKSHVINKQDEITKQCLIINLPTN